MKRYIFFAVLLITSLGSCKKYLQQYSQDLAYASNASDLNELLLGSGYQTLAAYQFLSVMDDDEEVFMNGSSTLDFAGYHYWQKYPSSMVGTAYTDAAWGPLYQSIAVVNVVIPKVESYRSDTLYAKVKGEAHFIRAKDYFQLINLYAGPYAKASAAQDPGVPLKLTEYVEDKYFSRNSVEQVYDSIVADLQQAIPLLKGVNQPSLYRANEYAARALLARVYLYMGNWQQASDQCDSILAAGKYSLMNLNTQPATTSFINTSSPEVMFTEPQNSGAEMTAANTDAYQYVYTYMPSSELVGLYQPDDLRFGFSFVPATNTSRLCYQKLQFNDTKVVSDLFSIRLAEVYLMKAETMAMLNRESDAITFLKELRQNRIQGGNAGNLNFTGPALIDTIRNERRRELCFEGLRWFDLRRYAVSPLYPSTKTIVHPFYVSPTFGTSQQAGYYQLNTYDIDHNAFALPIPQTEIIVNNGALVDNPRDDRPIKQ